MKIQVSLNEGPRPFSKGDYNDIVLPQNHWSNFNRTCKNTLGLKRLNFVEIKGRDLFQGGVIVPWLATQNHLLHFNRTWHIAFLGKRDSSEFKRTRLYLRGEELWQNSKITLLLHCKFCTYTHLVNSKFAIWHKNM